MASWCHLSVLAAKWPEMGNPDMKPPVRESVCRARFLQPAASRPWDATRKHVLRSRISNEMSWAGGCLWNVGAWLPGFQILLGSVVREVRSLLPGVHLPHFLLTAEPAEGSPPSRCSLAQCHPLPRVHTVTPTQPTHSPLGESWVQPGSPL